jgi:Uncharacterized conserved protein
MIEHRLIMRMISLIDKEVKKIDKFNMVDQSFIDIVVDFIKTFADRTHHGKEEDLLIARIGAIFACNRDAHVIYHCFRLPACAKVF